MAWSAPKIGTVAEVASGNLTLTEPTGVAQGDLLIACIAIRSNVGFANGDWSKIDGQLSGNTVSTGAGIASGEMWYCIRGASAPSLVFTRTGGDLARGAILAYSGGKQDLTAVLGAHSSNTLASTSTTATTGTITTAEANELIVAMIAQGDNYTASAFDAATNPTTASGATDTSTAPTAGTWIERTDSGTNTGADGGLAVADAVRATAGATGTIQVTSTGSARHVMIAAAFRLLVEVTVAAGVGAATVTGFAPAVSISSGTTVSPGVGVVSAAGFAPTILNYAKHLRVTIDHTQVGGSTLTDFPVVIQITSAELKTVANGGFVNNLDTDGAPADFVVAGDLVGVDKYQFRTTAYDPATGAIKLWVRVPSVSPSVDTVFYLNFSDPLVTTSQSIHTGVWDSNYKGVYLLDGAATDQTPNAYHATESSPNWITGQVNSAFNFTGGSDVITVPTFANYSRPMTFEFWAKFPFGSISSGDTVLQASSFSGNFLLYTRQDVEGKGYATVGLFTSVGEAGIPYPEDGNWHHFVIAVNSSGTLIGVMDGVLKTTFAITPGALTPQTSTALKFGNGLAALIGALDEIRFSSTDRISASNYAWAIASYNNQKSSSTFLTVDTPPTNISVNTGLGQLVATGFVPTLSQSDNKIVATGVGALTATGFAPGTVVNGIVRPSVGTVTATGFAPTVVASNHQTVATGAGAAVVAGFTPTVTVSNNQSVTTGVGAVAAAGFAPTVAVSNNIRLQTGLGTVTAAGFASVIAVSNNQLVSVGLGALTATGFAPVAVINNILPLGVGSLAVTGFAPVVTVSDLQVVNPDAGIVLATGFAPTVATSDLQTVAPGVGVLTVSGFSPTVALSDHKLLTPGVGTLVATGFSPLVVSDNNTIVAPEVGAVVAVGLEPSVVASANVLLAPGVGQVLADGFAPTLATNTFLEIGLGELVLTGYAPNTGFGEDPAISHTGQFYPR